MFLKKNVLSVLAAAVMILFAGCSDPAEEKAKSNAALRAEFKELIESIHIIEKGILTVADRADIVNADIMLMLDKYKRINELTGISFYSWVISTPGSPYYTNEHFQKLTERTPRLIPLYVEDEMSGTLYFAPPPEQEFIINKYKEWFASKGQTFDFDAVQNEMKNNE